MLTTIYAQFSDATEKTIIAVYGGPQDPADYPNQGAIASDDPRYVSYYDAQYPQIQQYLIKPGA